MIAQLDAPLAWIKEHIDLKIFLRGLMGVGGVYLILFVLVWAQSSNTVDKLQSRMVSRTTSISSLKAEQITRDAIPDETHVTTHPSPAPHKSADQQLPYNELQASPIEGLYEDTDKGLLPIVNKENGLTAFNAYKRPFATTQTPIISIIVEDFGLSAIQSTTVIENLPTEVTLLLSSYISDIESWQDKARASGHETWINLPVETDALAMAKDTGPQTILATDGLKQHDSKLEWAMMLASGYVGFGASIDHVILGSPVILKKMIASIFDRGLAFLELNPDSSGEIETMAITAQAPYLKADLYINDRSATQSPFKRLETIARKKGYALGVLSPSQSSIEQVNIWLKSLEAKGLTLAPASAIADRQMSGYVQKNDSTHQ